MYQLYCYEMMTGRASLSPVVYNTLHEAYLASDRLNERKASLAFGLAYCPIRIKRRPVRQPSHMMRVGLAS